MSSWLTCISAIADLQTVHPLGGAQRRSGSKVQAIRCTFRHGPSRGIGTGKCTSADGFSSPAWPPSRAARPCRLVAVIELVQSGADLGGLGVAEVAEGVERMLPGAASRIDVAGGVMGVAEGGERVGFAEAAVELAVQLDRGVVARDGPGMATKMIKRVPKAVPRFGLAEAIAE